MREKTWKERALDELTELRERIVKLQLFVQSDSDKVSPLHIRQLEVMFEYDRILTARREKEDWDTEDWERKPE